MAIIEIGSTKQLFVDDYLIESLANAKQGLNQAVKADDNPVLRRERPWEGNYMRPIKVIFDEKEGDFKMWYTASTSTVRLENGKPVVGGPAGFIVRGRVTCLATSEDGIHWERPSLGLVEFDGSTDNNILPERENLPTVPDFQDLHEKDPGKPIPGAAHDRQHRDAGHAIRSLLFPPMRSTGLHTKATPSSIPDRSWDVGRAASKDGTQYARRTTSLWRPVTIGGGPMVSGLSAGPRALT